ncbi:MAG: Sec-independent protein translocase protein TatB [Gammaproteobacteria bacterium]|nr:Sec-independent protein translocase protein TatB [Gammaproteobacteria bacterium]MCF6363947.1 Sec-independent protein translocase protein TatB [Gammaproteobacteria bacterium]
MFDIGFWELGLIGVVALLVIGPERLPGVARSAGMWIGRVKRFVSTTQAEISQELGKADELKHLLEEQTRVKSAHEIIEQTANDVRESLSMPSLKPDYLLKAEDRDDYDEESTPSQTARPAASPSTQAAPSPSHEPLKADDVKHDRSA